MIYNQVEMSNHICKRYIERVLNISKPAKILSYLKIHEYEINIELFKLLRKSQFLYEGNFDDPTYKKKSFYLSDDILLIFSNNIGVTLYKANSGRNLHVNETILQIGKIKNKIEQLENEKLSIIKDIEKNRSIKLFLESELLKNNGPVVTYLRQSIITQDNIINDLQDKKNDIKAKINSSKDIYTLLVKKIVFGKWINIDQQILINDIIEN